MTLPACLNPDWRAINPVWEAERRFVEVIVHGTGPLRRAESLCLWSGDRPYPTHIPLRKRIWLDAVACRFIADMQDIRITKLRECDEIPHSQ